jgi:hypothetical protein
MAGKNGAKQAKKLEENEIKDLLAVLFQIKDRNFLWLNDLEDICDRLKVSRLSLMRRASVCGIRFGIVHPLERVHDTKLAGKAIIAFDCASCSSSYFEIKRDLLDRGSIEICGKCLRRNKSRSPERRALNSRAQRIAQNKPETKNKMSRSVRAAWARDYDKRCESIRRSYRENPAHRENVSKASLRVWRDDSYALKMEKISRSKSGHYKGIFYQSLCELAFLLWCEESNKTVKRFKGSIPYELDGKTRSYRPDFVVDEKLVVEVKHSLQHEIDLGRVKSVESKYDSLREYCRINGLSARLVEVSKDLSLHYKQAREVHNGEVASQDSVPLCRKGS